MAESETPALVLRKTSFTMRQRLTPARACLTRTRRLANLRLVRFSAGVRSAAARLFFSPGRSQLPPARILGIPYPCTRSPQADRRCPPDQRSSYHGSCRRRSAQEIDALALQRGDDHVLVAVGLLLPALVCRLFFRVFRPLTPPFSPIDDQLRGRRLTSGETTGFPLRQDTQIIEGRS